MNTAELIRMVATKAEIETEHSEAMINATLRTLGERINGDEAKHLAAQLPGDIGAPLVEAADESADGERFDADEFVERVAKRVGTAASESERTVKAVFDTLREAVATGEWADVLSQLPNDMDRLTKVDQPSDHTG